MVAAVVVIVKVLVVTVDKCLVVVTDNIAYDAAPDADQGNPLETRAKGRWQASLLAGFLGIVEHITAASCFFSKFLSPCPT